MAIDKEGNVYTWGYNQNGQLGDGTRISNSTGRRQTFRTELQINIGR